MANVNGDITVEIIDKEIMTVELPHGVHAHTNKNELDKVTDGDHDIRTDNPHSVTKGQVGLSNCDNTSDVNKPVSTATQAALDALEAEIEASDVDSVNGQTGTVVLTQDNIGDGTTYKQYSQTEKTKLAGIETNAVALATVKADTDVADAISKKHSHANILVLNSIQEALTTALKSSYDAAVVASHSHANKTTLDAIEQAFTTALKSAYDSCVVNNHTHANKSTLDNIQEAFTTALKSAYDAAVNASHSHANKATLDLIQEALTTALKSAYDGAVSLSHSHANSAALNNVSGTNTGDQTADTVPTDDTGISVQDKIDTYDGYLDQAVKTTSDPTFNDATVDKLQIKETAYFDAEVDNGNSGAADTIDWRVGNKQKSTLSENCAYTFTAPPGPCNLVLKCINFGAFAPTLPNTMRWPGGTIPSWTASGTDILCMYYDGSVYHSTVMLDSKASA
jgi:hypothetical protein